MSNKSMYEKSEAELARSRIWREVRDKARVIVWVILLFGCCYPPTEPLSDAVLGKILKDVGSFDAHMDKYSKSLVPAWKLIRTSWGVRTGDGPNRVMERDEPMPPEPRRSVDWGERAAFHTVFHAPYRMYLVDPIRFRTRECQCQNHGSIREANWFQTNATRTRCVLAVFNFRF